MSKYTMKLIWCSRSAHHQNIGSSTRTWLMPTCFHQHSYVFIANAAIFSTNTAGMTHNMLGFVWVEGEEYLHIKKEGSIQPNWVPSRHTRTKPTKAASKENLFRIEHPYKTYVTRMLPYSEMKNLRLQQLCKDTNNLEDYECSCAPYPIPIMRKFCMHSCTRLVCPKPESWNYS